MSSAPSSEIPCLLLFALAVASGQLSRLAVLESFRFMERLNTASGFSDLTLVYNTGAAFSSLVDQGGQQKLFFLALAAAISLYLTRVIRCDDFGRWGKIGATMIIGGMVGNVVDRLFYGRVVDLLLFYWQDWFYPAFSIADSFIYVDAVLLIANGSRNKEPFENRNREKQ